MRAERPLHHLARTMQHAQCFSQVKRFDAQSLLISEKNAPGVAIYLFDTCPTPRHLGHILAQNSQQALYSLLVLDGDILFGESDRLEATLSMLDIFYPRKAYVYKVLDDEISVLPVYMDWPEEHLKFYVAPPVDLLQLHRRDVEMERTILRVADFGARPPYNPRARFERWQAKYGGGNGGRNTHKRRRRSTTYRGYAAHQHYEALGLSRGASFEDIRAAYRQRARELHPDVNPSPEAKAQMQRINEAYAALVKATYILRK